jgi:hypothetical protein
MARIARQPGGEVDESGRNVHRRAFLKAAGTTAALAPGIALLGDLLDAPRVEAATLADGASGAAVRAGVTGKAAPPLLLGGAEVRPPSVPLAVRSPYLSTWLPATDLTATTPQFWYGGSRGFAGLVRIDGQVYAWAGPAAGEQHGRHSPGPDVAAGHQHPVGLRLPRGRRRADRRMAVADRTG